jgi:phosphate starvation-inducible PhoH-like protein
MRKARKTNTRDEQPRGRKESPQIDSRTVDQSLTKFAKPNNHIAPKTENQSRLINSINQSEITIVNGPAGVGKTFIVGGVACKMFNQGDVDKIVLTRANVGVGKSIGLLPGTVEEKMSPLLMPILSVLRGRMGDGLYAYNMAKKKIEMQPLEFVRGMSFKDTFLIIDEAQNLTVDDVKALITRFESGRIVFMGDPMQSDIKGMNGLDWLTGFSAEYDLDYPTINFDLEDIVRSELVKKFLFALYASKGIKPSGKKSALLTGPDVLKA